MIVLSKFFVLVFVTFVIGQNTNYNSDRWNRIRIVNLLQRRNDEEKSFNTPIKKPTGPKKDFLEDYDLLGSFEYDSDQTYDYENKTNTQGITPEDESKQSSKETEVLKENLLPIETEESTLKTVKSTNEPKWKEKATTKKTFHSKEKSEESIDHDNSTESDDSSRDEKISEESTEESTEEENSSEIDYEYYYEIMIDYEKKPSINNKEEIKRKTFKNVVFENGENVGPNDNIYVNEENVLQCSGLNCPKEAFSCETIVYSIEPDFFFINSVTKCFCRDFSVLDTITSKTKNPKVGFPYHTGSAMNRNGDVISIDNNGKKQTLRANGEMENNQQVFEEMNNMFEDQNSNFNKKMDSIFNGNFFNNH